MTSSNPAGRQGRPARKQGETAAARRRFATTRVAAEYLDVHERTVRKMIAEGRLTGYRNGKILRVDMNEVETCLQPSGGSAA